MNKEAMEAAKKEASIEWRSTKDEFTRDENHAFGDGFEAGYKSRDEEVANLQAEISKLVVALDTDYCETCAVRDGIFDHLKGTE